MRRRDAIPIAVMLAFLAVWASPIATGMPDGDCKICIPLPWPMHGEVCFDLCDEPDPPLEPVIRDKKDDEAVDD